jgi:hypothetical protein
MGSMLVQNHRLCRGKLGKLGSGRTRLLTWQLPTEVALSNLVGRLSEADTLTAAGVEVRVSERRAYVSRNSFRAFS